MARLGRLGPMGRSPRQEHENSDLPSTTQARAVGMKGSLVDYRSLDRHLASLLFISTPRCLANQRSNSSVSIRTLRPIRTTAASSSLVFEWKISVRKLLSENAGHCSLNWPTVTSLLASDFGSVLFFAMWASLTNIPTQSVATSSPEVHCPKPLQPHGGASTSKFAPDFTNRKEFTYVERRSDHYRDNAAV